MKLEEFLKLEVEFTFVHDATNSFDSRDLLEADAIGFDCEGVHLVQLAARNRVTAPRSVLNSVHYAIFLSLVRRLPNVTITMTSTVFDP
jgi:hypothetical protein